MTPSTSRFYSVKLELRPYRTKMAILMPYWNLKLHITIQLSSVMSTSVIRLITARPKRGELNNWVGASAIIAIWYK